MEKIASVENIRIAIGILFLTLLLVNLFVGSREIRLISSAFLVALLAISILQIYYLMRVRKRIPSLRA